MYHWYNGPQRWYILVINNMMRILMHIINFIVLSPGSTPSSSLSGRF